MLSLQFSGHHVHQHHACNASYSNPIMGFTTGPLGGIGGFSDVSGRGGAGLSFGGLIVGGALKIWEELS